MSHNLLSFVCGALCCLVALWLSEGLACQKENTLQQQQTTIASLELQHRNMLEQIASLANRSIFEDWNVPALGAVLVLASFLILASFVALRDYNYLSPQTTNHTCTTYASRTTAVAARYHRRTWGM